MGEGGGAVPSAVRGAWGGSWLRGAQGAQRCAVIMPRKSSEKRVSHSIVLILWSMRVTDRGFIESKNKEILGIGI